MCFGHVSHNLKDESYEYDFGIRVTLNSLDPEKIKSTDLVEPASAKRRRIQSPVESGMSYFDFDRDSTIVKSLTGKVKDEYKKFFKHASGSANLRLSSDVIPADVGCLCKELLDIYKKDDYKNIGAYQDILNVAPVKDPVKVQQLNQKLVEAFKAKSVELMLTIPDLVEYEVHSSLMFAGYGGGDIYSEVSMLNFHKYLSENDVLSDGYSLEILENASLVICNDEGEKQRSYSLYRSLIFDTRLDSTSAAYHFCEGNWYEVESRFIDKMRMYLDPYFVNGGFVDYAHKDEATYNCDVAETHAEYLCLDRTNIAPVGNMEPCDLYTVKEDQAVFLHVKVSTRSSMLSHLFNQGANSFDLIRNEPESLERLNGLITSKIGSNDLGQYLTPIKDRKEKVIYLIATTKSIEGKSDNLPLFSRISLYKAVKHLRLLGVTVEVSYVADKTMVGESKPKLRKKRTHKNVGSVGNV